MTRTSKDRRFKRMNTAERQRHFKQIFTTVVEPYLEVRETSSSNSCEELYKRLREQVNGLAGSGGGQRVGRVYPTCQDFIADVELAVKKVVNAEEYRNFIQDVPLSDELRSRIGREFHLRKLDLLKLYFKPKDVA